MAEITVSFKNITKTFGEVVANHDVSFDVYKGEILALLGENGSGKTTLMNMLSGIYFPDHGTIEVNGKEATIRSPKDAFSLGIGMVHQHFKLVDVFTAVENTVLGLNRKQEKYNLKEASRKIKDICEKYGFEIDPKKKIYNMSVSEKQTLEIVKVLYRGADILILDEPTAVLTPQETEKLFDVMRNMREDGKSIIIITHKLNEVMEISDRVAVLRKGEFIGAVNTSETSEHALTDMMVGRKTTLNIDRPEPIGEHPLLEIRDLVVKNDEGAVAIDGMSFYIRGGEILGVAGISGCGQKELCEAIAGLRKVYKGEINHMGDTIIGLSPKAIIEKGIAMSFIPEDRLGMGLAPSLSVTDNMMLKDYKNATLTFKEATADEKAKRLPPVLWPFVDRNGARKRAEAIIKELDIVTPSTETPVRRLSGGNVQKVLVGREIQSGPNVIITAYPVRGLDINSSYAIYNILNEEKKKGTGIMYVGEDLDVLLALCDKIMVICHGKLMGVVHADKTTKEEIGLMMTGALDLTEVKSDKQYGIAVDTNIDEADLEAMRQRDAQAEEEEEKAE